MWSLINVSINLHTTDVKLTGLLFSGLFLDPLVLGVSHQLPVIYYLSSS